MLACFESIAAGRDVNINTASASAAATATAAAGSAQYDDGSASAAAGGELPDTGGTSLFALGVGVMLVAGGLLARRIFR